jgi:hypothetical protein
MRQNDDRRTPDLSAERHLRVLSRSASTLGVGQYAARSKPAIRECVQQLGRHDNKEVHVVMT